MERLSNLIRNKLLPNYQNHPLFTLPQEIRQFKSHELDTSNFELSEEERRQWEESYLGRSFIGDYEYSMMITLKDNNDLVSFGFLRTNPSRVAIDIPLAGDIAYEELINKAYAEGTFFGEVDPEKFKEFATESFTKNELLVLLNRNYSGVESDEDSDWFFEKFQLDHNKSYKDVAVSSHGGGRSFYAEIIPNIAFKFASRHFHETYEESKFRASNYRNVTQKSLPHLTITPLPVDSYLQLVEDNLPFLPRNWAK